MRNHLPQSREGGAVLNKRVYGARKYRGFRIALAEKSDPIYKAQADAFQSAVLGETYRDIS